MSRPCLRNSLRRSEMRVLTLVNLVSLVSADSVQGSPFESASRMIDFVSVFMLACSGLLAAFDSKTKNE